MAFGGRSHQKMSEETFEFVRTTYAEDNKTVEAVKYCVECSGYYCQSCTDAHKFPALRSHKFLHVRQGKQASGQTSLYPVFPSERCSMHIGKVMNMYCQSHDVVGCHACIAKDHKSCEDSQIHSIPDMIHTIFKLSDCKQTHSLLKDMLASIETVTKTKETKLQSLNKAKKEAIGKVNVFQQALEAILSKIAESSRKEIEDVYKQLEKDVMNEQRTIDNIREALKTTDDKLIKSEDNRAQRFVCSKIAQKKIKQAFDVMAKQELKQNSDVEISFMPNQSLMEYIQALHSVGKVQKNISQKHDLYKIKGSKDITMKLSHDSKTCGSCGCCLTHDNQLLVTDYNNKKLKRIDIQNMSVIDYCTFNSEPNGVCCISKHEVAVACQSENMIQFVSIDNTMTSTRQIKTPHSCFGIAFNDNKLHVTDFCASFYIYDMTGTLLKTIMLDNAGNELFNYSQHVTLNVSGDRMFVGGGAMGLVCMDGMGNYVSTINDTDIEDTDGVSVDGRGHVFVIGYKSQSVVQFRENGKKVGVVVKLVGQLQVPRSVCFLQGLNIMFVTTNSDAVKMYELE